MKQESSNQVLFLLLGILIGMLLYNINTLILPVEQSIKELPEIRIAKIIPKKIKRKRKKK